MTPEQKLDLLERLARSLCERPWLPRRESRKPGRQSRKQSAVLGDYVKALTEYDAAKQALEQEPDDSEKNEILNRARELLDQVREELKRSTRNGPGRLPP